MNYNKPNLFYYRIAQVVSWIAAVLLFKRRFLRNEIKGKKGPFVVIANHQAALDFVNLIGATGRPMSFVISNSFYNTLPIKGFLNKMGVIPKQQFQTTVKDLKKIKAVIDHGQPVVIYPAGLMCEDGLSTPIPAATCKFLKWLGTDVYVARTKGTYFAMPKWAKGIRPGKTYLDIYKLFSADELDLSDFQDVKNKINQALLFDAYREQEDLLVRYKGNDNIEGIEQVLYMCPNCREEFSMHTKGKNIIYCDKCGYQLISDKYGFLHNEQNFGPKIRYVSDWSRAIYDDLRGKIEDGIESGLSSESDIYMIDYKKNKFKKVGSANVSLSFDRFLIDGVINDSPINLSTSLANVPALPFSPGKYFEIQNKNEIYRCAPKDPKLVMKYINMVKIFYEIRSASDFRCSSEETLYKS